MKIYKITTSSVEERTIIYELIDEHKNKEEKNAKNNDY